MSETIPHGAHSQENDEALNAWEEDKWEAQEAINRAAIAKEYGFKPWGGFAPSAPSKTPPLSKEEQEKAKTRQQEALQRWLDQGLPKEVPVATMPEKLEEVPTPRPERQVQPIPAPEEPQPEPEPEASPASEARRAAASPAVRAIEAAVKQHRPRKPTQARKLPHGGCTGVWIPKEVYEDPRFDSFNEMILYLEINHLDQENGCTAKNQHFAAYLGCNVQTVQDMIRSMAKRGIFLCVYPSRTSRIIHIAGGRKSYPRHRG